MDNDVEANIELSDESEDELDEEPHIEEIDDEAEIEINVPAVPQVIPQAPQAPQVQAQVQNNLKKEFGGSVGAKPNWKQCCFCDRYYPSVLYLADLNHCAHCWAWVNGPQLDLVAGTYTGTNTIDEVKNFLKQTYSAHDSNLCKTTECVYNKINTLKNSQTLNHQFCVELGFVKPKPILINETNDKTIKQTRKTNLSDKKEHEIKKRGYLKFNYSSSSITI